MRVHDRWLVTAAALLGASAAAAQPPPTGPNSDPADHHCSLREMCPSGVLCTTGLAGTEPSWQYRTCNDRARARGLVPRCSHTTEKLLRVVLCPRGKTGSWPGSKERAKAELAARTPTEPAEASPPTKAPTQASPSAPAAESTARQATSGAPAKAGPSTPTKRTPSPPSPPRSSNCAWVPSGSPVEAWPWPLWALALALMNRKRAASKGRVLP
jgi:hypothetical protein